MTADNPGEARDAAQPAWLSGLLIFLALTALAGALPVAATLTHLVAYGNEGWSAYHQAEAAAGNHPYPPPSSLMYNDYPPLSFYVVGFLGKFIGDNVFAGRIVSFAAFLLTGLGVFGAARAMRCARPAALFAALMFANLVLFDHGDAGTNDPQFLGHALELSGLILCLRAPRATAHLFLSAFLFALAFFTKANLIALPLAVTAWFFLSDRKSGWAFMLSGLMWLLLGLAAFQWAFARSLWSVIAISRVWIFGYALHATAGRLPALLLPLLALLLLWRRFPKDPYLRLGLLYLAISLASAFYFLGGAGTGGNMLFDATIALSLSAGIGINRLMVSVGQKSALAFAASFLLPLIAIMIFTTATGRFPRYWHVTEVSAETRADIAFLQAHDGPALCQVLTLCYWAGKPAEADLWGYEQAVSLHQRDGRELPDAIRARRYSVLELGQPPNRLGAWPETDPAYAGVLGEAIKANYRLDHRDRYGAFWVRR